ncbi:clock controlled protein [Rhodotorula toruloides]|uniref:Clock controlled protein n=1 Tax=Rhodotorula toruloides TaxID=5286 RepID=A0A511K6X9_RHOTO|nr:clock controlled protein [Rhodotorula toruloides]
MAAAAHPLQPPQQLSLTPPSRQHAQPSCDPFSSQAEQDPPQDDSMTDDMKIAISALGLMREGSLGAGRAHEAAPAMDHDGASPSSVPSVSVGQSPTSLEYREPSILTRGDPSRSTSIASTTSASEAWMGAGTSETGYSSPATSASISRAVTDDAEMSEKGLGEADLDWDGVGEEGVNGNEDPRFMARVSQLPIVSGGLEWYERSKANSRVVKYGAGLVVSSFSAVSRPIANTHLGRATDEFACRQLDRIGAPGASPGRKSPASRHSRQLTAEASPSEEDGRPASRRPRLDQRTSSSSTVAGGAGDRQIAMVPGGQRSRWQTVLLEAGGLGAAVSEESLKSLRYCLQWLLYATAHLDHQIGILRGFIISLRSHTGGSSSPSSNALVAASASAHLAQIKHDVVETIRKVVEVVSKYAGAALPEQAKRYVRQSILGLPVKWASAIEGGRRSREGSVSEMSAAGESDIGTPRPERMHESYFPGAAGSSQGPVESSNERVKGGHASSELNPTAEAADRILTFAVESLDMLRSVTGIFGESVERAEAWIERFRIVGLDRQRQRQAAADAPSFFSPPAPSSAPALPSPDSVGHSPPTPHSATFDSAASSPVVAGTKRRRATATSTTASEAEVEGLAANGRARATGVDAGHAAEEAEDSGASRRKRGAWRESVENDA